MTEPPLHHPHISNSTLRQIHQVHAGHDSPSMVFNSAGTKVSVKHIEGFVFRRQPFQPLVIQLLLTERQNVSSSYPPSPRSNQPEICWVKNGLPVHRCPQRALWDFSEHPSIDSTTPEEHQATLNKHPRCGFPQFLHLLPGSYCFLFSCELLDPFQRHLSCQRGRLQAG